MLQVDVRLLNMNCQIKEKTPFEFFLTPSSLAFPFGLNDSDSHLNEGQMEIKFCQSETAGVSYLYKHETLEDNKVQTEKGQGS